jgi:thiol-disulfide isomerase/thioredoxin
MEKNLFVRLRQNTLGRITILCVAMACVIFVFSNLAGSQQRKRSHSTKHPAPQTTPAQLPQANYGSYDFSMPSIDGAKIHLASYAGKVVLVDIWSPSCGPCKMETPGFVKLYEKYHTKGLEIIGVAVQSNETEIRSFIQTNSIRWVTGLDDSIIITYGMYGLPDHYLFNATGGLIKHFIGYARDDVVEPYIEKAVQGIIPQPSVKKK